MLGRPAWCARGLPCELIGQLRSRDSKGCGAVQHSRGEEAAVPDHRARRGGRGDRGQPGRSPGREGGPARTRRYAAPAAGRCAAPSPSPPTGIRSRRTPISRGSSGLPDGLLLDTHLVLWWLADHATLNSAVKSRLDIDAEIFVSAATVWEVGIKQALGKLVGDGNLAERVRDSGFVPLPITADHAITAAALPFRHKDPFGPGADRPGDQRSA